MVTQPIKKKMSTKTQNSLWIQNKLDEKGESGNGGPALACYVKGVTTLEGDLLSGLQGLAEFYSSVIYFYY